MIMKSSAAYDVVLEARIKELELGIGLIRSKYHIVGNFGGRKLSQILAVLCPLVNVFSLESSHYMYHRCYYSLCY